MGLSLSSDLVADVLRSADPARLRAATARLQALESEDDGVKGFTNLLGSLDSGRTPDASASGSSSLFAAQSVSGAEDFSTSAYVGFERMVLRNLLESLLPDAESGAFGKGPSAGVWRTLAADQLAGIYAHAGGIGIAESLASDGERARGAGELQWPYFSTESIKAFTG